MKKMMKKLLFFSTLILLAAGCGKEEVPAAKNFTIIANMGTTDTPVVKGGDEDFVESEWNPGGPDTRTTLGADGKTVTWNANDAIGVSLISGSALGSPVSFTTSSGGTTHADFTGSALAAGNYHAFYPYTAGTLNGGTIQSTLPVLQAQTGTASSHIGTLDFCYSAASAGVNSGAMTASFDFYHAFTLLEFNVTFTSTVLNPAATLSKIELIDATTGHNSFMRTAIMDYTGAVNFSTPTNSVGVTVNHAFNTTGQTFKAWMLVATPASSSGDHTVNLRLTMSDNQTITITKRLPAAGFAPGKRYTVGVNMNMGLIPSVLQTLGQLSTATINALSTLLSGTTVQISSAVDLALISGLISGTLNIDPLAATLFNVLNLGTDKTFSGKTLVLNTNLDLSGQSWVALGTSTYKFSGTFDGNGKTILGLNLSTGNDKGLFGVIGTGGVVKNVTVAGGALIGTSRVGAIAGTNSGTIENCHNYGTAISGSSDIGGIVGLNDRGTVVACTNAATVMATVSNAGGIAGRSENSTTNGYLLACRNSGAVSAVTSNAGGIAGNNATNSRIASSINSGSVTGPNGSIATLAGINSGTVTNCFYLQSGALAATNGTAAIITASFTIPSGINLTTLNTPIITGGSYVTPAASWHWNAGAAGEYPVLSK